MKDMNRLCSMYIFSTPDMAAGYWLQKQSECRLNGTNNSKDGVPEWGAN